jgi:hypothetical protein
MYHQWITSQLKSNLSSGKANYIYGIISIFSAFSVSFISRFIGGYIPLLTQHSVYRLRLITC